VLHIGRVGGRIMSPCCQQWGPTFTEGGAAALMSVLRQSTATDDTVAGRSRSLYTIQGSKLSRAVELWLCPAQ
jgi:hypothetical protein